MNLVGKASEDLRSQRGRVASNLNLARNFGETILANGVIDDRKYLVGALRSTTRHSLSLTLGSMRASSSWRHHCPIPPGFVMT